MKRYFKHVIHFYILTIILELIAAVTSSVIFTVPGYYADNYNKGFDFLMKMIAAIVIAFIIYILSALLDNIVGVYRRRKFESLIKKDFFDVIIDKNYQNFHNKQIEEYISIQSNDINALCQNYLGPIGGLFRSFILIIVYSVFLIIYVDVKIVILIVSLTIIALFVPKLTNKWVSNRNQTYFEQLEKYITKIASLFRGYDILDDNSRKVFKSKHEQELDSTIYKQFKARLADNIALVVNGGFCESIRVIVFIFAAYLLYLGELTVGAFIITMTYSSMFLDPLHEFNLNVGRIKSVSSIKDKVVLFLTKEESTSGVVDEITGNLVLENVQVNFKNFSTKPTSCNLKQGKKYLIAGDNGTGKSTLLKSIMQFINTYEGDMKINDKSIKSQSVVNAFAYVPQHGYVMDDTNYYDNISLYGTYDISNLSEYEKYFPENIIEKLKNKSVLKNISGGEKQVISLLRALCTNKNLLVLDEPFSAMSRSTYIKCFSELLKTDRTIIFVMHNDIEDQSVFNNIINM